MASKCSSERKTQTSLTLNQKLEMMKLSEEGMSKAKIGLKAGFLQQTLSGAVSAKEKFSKEIKSASPANTQMIRKQNSLLADCRKSQCLDRRSNQPPHSLKAKPNPEQGPDSLQFCEG